MTGISVYALIGNDSVHHLLKGATQHLEVGPGESKVLIKEKACEVMIIMLTGLSSALFNKRKARIEALM